MAHDPDQGGSRPSAAAGAPAATGMAAAGGALTVGSILTVAGILLLFAFFALGLISLQYCFNAWGRGRGGAPAGDNGGGSGSGSRARGVDPDLLRSLPVTVYRAAPGPKAEDAAECAVCLAELGDGEEARFLPRCGHGFHAECVDTWLASHTTCPLCRLTVAKPDASPPPPAAALLPVPPERANYAASVLPGAVLDDRAAVATVIEIPESAVQTPRDSAKSPGSARLRSIRRLWSFGRQGAGPSSSCSCAGEGSDVDQGTSVTIAVAVAVAVAEPATAGTTRGGVV